MDPRIGRPRRRRALGAALIAALLGVGAVGLVRAQQASPSSPADNAIALPDEEAPKQIEITPDAPTPRADEQPRQPLIKPEPVAAVTMGGKPVVEPQDAKAPPPPPPPKPIRSPVAILQALDKVTAETIRFAAPVGQKVRYKNLIFSVKACETSGLDDPQPQSAAYITVDSQPRETVGRAPPTKQVFKGWMFATAPGLHPLEHPVYDAWLVACSASAPAT